MTSKARSRFEILGRIPWSVVVDFETRLTKSLFDAVQPDLSKSRAVHQTMAGDSVEVNFSEATNWFMAAGLEGREGTVKSDYDAWRRTYLKHIRDLLGRLRRVGSAKPIIVLLLIGDIGDEYLRATWECIDETLEDQARCVIVHEGRTVLEELKRKPFIKTIDCVMGELIAGLWQVYGLTSSSTRVCVPGRGSSGKDRVSVPISDRDYQYLKEDLEVVHAGLVEDPGEGRRIGHDFWRGHKITWTELDMEADVRRGDLAER